MGKLENWIQQLKQISQQQISNAVLDIMRKHQAQLVDLNINQLMHGKNESGGVLGTYSTNGVYGLFKRRIHPLAGGKVDVWLEGDFYKGFFLEADKWPVTVFSHDSKTPKLTAFYEGIFGFTKESKAEIVEDTKDEIQEYFKKAMLPI